MYIARIAMCVATLINIISYTKSVYFQNEKGMDSELDQTLSEGQL